MATRTFSMGAANGGVAAYERRRIDMVSAALPAVAPARKESSFSLGPFTLRYEEEERVDFSAVAKAALTQLNTVRRFNFAEALQTESARADLSLAPPSAADQAAAAMDGETFVPAEASAAASPAELMARAAGALENLTYGADGLLRRPRLYFSSGRENAPAAGGDSAGKSGLEPGTARARAALAAYLAADNAMLPAPRPGRLVSGAV